MSPNAYLWFNPEYRLLCGYQGEGESEEPVFKWTYSVFEEYYGEAVTPSVYHFCANYIDENINKEELYEIQGGDYCPGQLEEEAVEAYCDLPWQERQRLHEQTTRNLENELRESQTKSLAYQTALLDNPWDPTSPIYEEYRKWVTDGLARWTKVACDVANELDEEASWRSGAEKGQSECGDAPQYDHMEEF